MKPAGLPLVADRAADLVPWVAAGVLGAAELHATDLLLRADPRAPTPVRLATALALWAPLHGHVCFDLARADELVAASLARTDDSADPTPLVLPWPDLGEWRAMVATSPLTRVVDRHDDGGVLDDRPLVLAGTNVFTQRQWVDECTVAEELRTRAALAQPGLGSDGHAVLDALWPRSADSADGAQRAAAQVAAESSVSAVVGGPGSGKTFTATGILAALAAQARADGRELAVGLAAPTGKAAQRMRDSLAVGLRRAVESGAIDDDIARTILRAEPTTVHRLLGSLPAVRTRFRHDATNPMPHDVVVVDESSMLSLALTSRLVEALRPDARLVLIGDPDQLESVDAGAVLADVVAASADPRSSLAGRVVRLGRSRRQDASSPIGPLAEAIRAGHADEALALLRGSSAELSFVEADDPTLAAPATAVRNVVLPPIAAARTAARNGRTRAALDAMSSVRILCAHRRGRFGADAWNSLVETWVLDGAPGRRNFAGRALLVTRNDLRNGLSNGDSGVMVTTPDGVAAAFAFGDEIRTFAPAQLQDVETAFATTVHKSQGSEYDTVVVVLPPPGSPLARRELLYTAVTRATRRVVVVGSVESLVTSVTTRTPRASGLVEALTTREGS
jgi:exodeoxyribonuclease V alpha subunit